MLHEEPPHFTGYDTYLTKKSNKKFWNKKFKNRTSWKKSHLQPVGEIFKLEQKEDFGNFTKWKVTWKQNRTHTKRCQPRNLINWSWFIVMVKIFSDHVGLLLKKKKNPPLYSIGTHIKWHCYRFENVGFIKAGSNIIIWKFLPDCHKRFRLFFAG